MEDITFLILDYLDLKSVMKCRQVSKSMKCLVDQSRRVWIRELHNLKERYIYEFSYSCAGPDVACVTEVFEDWEDVFEYFEKEADTEKLREFTCALRSPYKYLANLDFYR